MKRSWRKSSATAFRRFRRAPISLHSLDLRAPYLETLDALVDWDRLRAAKFRFVIDPMHGAGRGLLRELFRRHEIACEEIRGTRDPLFGGVNPEPIEPHIAALQRAVVQGKFDAGFALDGDADRIGAVDRDGSFINPHQIFSILLWHLAGTRKLAGAVAKTFSTTKMIDKIAAKFGRQVWETPIGFKYICDRMLESDILLGGEESGGIGTKLHLPERDATVNALLLAEVMAWHGKSLGELVALLHQEFGGHYYNRVDLHVKNGQKEKAIGHFSIRESPAPARLAHYPPRKSRRHQSLPGRHRLADAARFRHRKHAAYLFRDHASGNHQARARRRRGAGTKIVSSTQRAFRGGGPLQMHKRRMEMEAVNLNEKLSRVKEYWSPTIIGELNDSYVKIVKFTGEFVWHHHDDEDEMFLVVKGRLRMHFRDREVSVQPGEFIIVPKGVEHKPEANEEVHVVLIEPKTTLNTGNVRNERTRVELQRL